MHAISPTASRYGAFFAIALAGASASAGADAPPTTAPSSEPVFVQPPLAQPLAVPKGVWTFETYGSYANQSDSREQIYSGTVGIGYYFIPDNSLTLEVTGVQAAQPVFDLGAGAADILLRNQLIHGNGWSGFIDFGAGMIESSHPIPPKGTDFDFMFKTGIGATVHLWDNTDLIAGVRYLHISNAHLEGPLRNPTLNAVEGYAGLLFKF